MTMVEKTCVNCRHGSRCDGCLEVWCVWGYSEEAAEGMGEYEIPMMVLHNPKDRCER